MGHVILLPEFYLAVVINALKQCIAIEEVY